MAMMIDHSVPLLIQIPAYREENGSFKQASKIFSQLGAKAMKNIRCITSSLTENNTETSYNFTRQELNKHLYGKKTVKPVDIERILRKRDLLEKESPPSKRSRILSTEEELDDIEMTYSIMSFPNDVQLCLSSIPGHKMGVCSKEFMPAGTWIGPYEGRRVPKGLLMAETRDSDFCWEVYKDGKLDHFLDGSDDNSSSWMRYVRCARNRLEQNMHAVQYGPNIYYRSFKDIKPGEELLVWYESQYEQYFGIPMFIKLSRFGNHRPTAIVNQVSGLQQENEAGKESVKQPAYVSKHNGLTIPRQFPPTVKQTKTSSIHYNDWARQTSSDSNSSPLSVSPVASPRHDNSPISTEEDRDIGVWKCGQCDQRFTQRSALRLHVCPSEANNPFHCGHCSLSFADPTKLRAHVVTHNNERPFKCGFCSRTFAGATTLNNHVRTHTGQKPFTCDKCGKSFSQASQMSRHQRLSEDCQ